MTVPTDPSQYTVQVQHQTAKRRQPASWQRIDGESGKSGDFSFLGFQHVYEAGVSVATIELFPRLNLNTYHMSKFSRTHMLCPIDLHMHDLSLSSPSARLWSCASWKRPATWSLRPCTINPVGDLYHIHKYRQYPQISPHRCDHPTPITNFNLRHHFSVSDDFRRQYLYNEDMDRVFGFMEVHISLGRMYDDDTMGSDL